MSNSQRIKIYADINASGSPENYISKSKIEIRNANPVKIEVVFLENGAYADVSSATGAVAEILDVGDFNSPPPSEPLLLARSVSALQSPFEAGAACQKSANSTCNAVFEFPSATAGFLRDDENYAQRYLSVRLCMPDNSEISYADGWIFVRRNFSSDPNFNPISSPKYITKTETEALVRDAVAGSHEHPEYLEKSENLSDLADAATARGNLNVYSKSETYSSLEIDDKEALDLKKASNLSDLADAATARTNLGVYATSETYSKTEIDGQEALNLKKASNLSDVSDVATARTNLGVYSSTEVDAKVQASAQALSCSKYSRGELWINGGSAATAAISVSAPFSLCATLGANFAGSFAFGGLSFSAASNVLTVGDGVDTITASLSAAKTQTLVFIQTESASTLYLDGAQAATGSLTFTSGTFGITGGTGTISNIKIFNFDISASGAAYSLADYQNGVDVPPMYKQGTLSASSSLTIGTDLTLGTTIFGTFVNSTTDLPVGATNKVVFGASSAIGTFTFRKANCAYVPAAAINLSSWHDKPVKISIKCKLKRNYAAGTGSVDRAQGFSIRYANNNFITTDRLSVVDELPEAGQWYNKEWQWEGVLAPNTYYGNNVYFTGCLYYYSGDTMVCYTDAFEMADLQISVNGELLELENYTHEDGATQKIFDVSGNNNDATITGNVAGTHDVSVKRLIDFITAQNS